MPLITINTNDDRLSPSQRLALQNIAITLSQPPRQPRALLSRGIRGKVTLHDGNTGKPRTLINIEKAAKLTVSEESRDGLRVRTYRENPDSRGHSPEEPMVLPTMPSDDDAFAA